jgi:uncharacterized alkaline shock family protein YloU
MSDYPGSPGKTTIAPEVLLTIARLTTLNVAGVSRMSTTPPVNVNRIFKRGGNEGVYIEVQDDAVFADIYVVLCNGFNIREVSQNIQRDVARAISEMVGMRVGRVNIHVEDIDFPAEAES